MDNAEKALMGFHYHVGNAEKVLTGFHFHVSYTEKALMGFHYHVGNAEKALMGFHYHVGNTEKALRGFHFNVSIAEKALIRPLPVLARLTSGTQFRCKQRWRQTMKMRAASSRYTERTQKTRAISVWLLAVPIVEERIGSWASRENTITFPEMKNAGVCG